MKIISAILSTVVLAFFAVELFAPSNTVNAQTPVECGTSITGEITSDREIHEYSLTLEVGDMVDIIGQVTQANYRSLTLDVGLMAPNGFVINGLEYHERSNDDSFVGTWELSDAGNYIIYVQGWTDTGGEYTLSINCTHSNGEVLSSSREINSIQCGAVVENEFALHEDGEETHKYYITLRTGDRFNITAESDYESYANLLIDVGVTAPNGAYVVNNLDYYNRSETSVVEGLSLSDSGIYVIYVQGWTDTGAKYYLYVGCTLADGTVINPGDTAPTQVVPRNPSDSNSVEIDNQFSGIGFPGLASVDFANAFTTSLDLNELTDGRIPPEGNAVLGYTVDAAAGDVLDLSFTRISGNLNLGLVVLSADNQVVFQASLITSDTLTTRFTLPTAGTYTIGLFRIDLLPPDAPEATAFQITATLNP